MKAKVHRRTVDLSAYPDLVVIYLGMRVNAILGLKTLLGFGPEIAKSVEAQPDGLLLHESMVFSLLPVHVGMRQYWRDFESLERSDPHRLWWRQFLCNSGGTGFWHEAYFMRGGMEAVYDDMVEDIGFLRFAPVLLARGTRFSARTRAQYPGEPAKPAPPVTTAFTSDNAAKISLCSSSISVTNTACEVLHVNERIAAF